MKHYKRIVYAALGLTIVLLFGGINDFLFAPIELPDRLPAKSFPPIAFSMAFLLFYLFFALIIAEYLSDSALKKKIWAPLSVLSLGTVWCVLYFLYGLDDVGCGVLFLSFFLLCYVVALSIKQSAFAVLYGLPVLCFYAFLVANALLLAIFSV